MAAKKRVTQDPDRPYVGSADPETLGPSDRVAHDILTMRMDLLPSIDRIMHAGLDEPSAELALTLFRDALDQPGDPNRDPRAAIAAATGAEAVQS